MRNKYIKIALDEKNEFRACADFVINGVGHSRINVKIDTGCGHTSIPVARLGLSKRIVDDWKYNDYANDSIRKVISFGVNDTDERKRQIKKEFREGTYNGEALSFIHEVKNIKINDVPIGNFQLRLNYHRTGNILIGMDILKTWDIHIRRIKSGETILLACPYNQINEEYLLELERTFKLGTLVSSAKVRDFIDFD